MKRSFEGNKIRHLSDEYMEDAQEDQEEWDEYIEDYRVFPDKVSDFLAKLDRSADTLPLPDIVGRLSQIVSELKEQLKDLVKVNGALETDLEEARRQVVQESETRGSLLKRIREIESRTLSMEDLRSENQQLSMERDALVGKVRNLGGMLTTSEDRVKELSELLDKFRTERNDACQEAECLSAQFSRAMKVVEELRCSLSDKEKQGKEYAARVEALENQLDEVVNQRDSYKSELYESRNALEEVRQSILAASRESGRLQNTR